MNIQIGEDYTTTVFGLRHMVSMMVCYADKLALDPETLDDLEASDKGLESLGRLVKNGALWAYLCDATEELAAPATFYVPLTGVPK